VERLEGGAPVSPAGKQGPGPNAQPADHINAQGLRRDSLPGISRNHRQREQFQKREGGQLSTTAHRPIALSRVGAENWSAGAKRAFPR